MEQRIAEQKEREVMDEVLAVARQLDTHHEQLYFAYMFVSMVVRTMGWERITHNQIETSGVLEELQHARQNLRVLMDMWRHNKTTPGEYHPLDFKPIWYVEWFFVDQYVDTHHTHQVFFLTHFKIEELLPDQDRSNRGHFGFHHNPNTLIPIEKVKEIETYLQENGYRVIPMTVPTH